MTDEIFGIVLLCPKHKVLWCIQWILINKDDKDVEDTILIDRKMQSIGIKVDKAQARGQEIGANPEEINEKFEDCKKFTGQRLSVEGRLMSIFHGVVNSDSYNYFPDNDSGYARTKALTFLGLFKARETGNLNEQTEVQQLSNTSLYQC